MTSMYEKDVIIDEINRKHKIEITKMEENIKYLEIENSMLKRKKKLYE